MGSFQRLNGLVSRFRKPESVIPYGALAAFYDALMFHVDYADWAEYIDRVFTVFSPDTLHVLEGACGTGSLTRFLSAAGYEMSGFDASTEMIAMARRKSLDRIWVGDLRASGARQEHWDAVLCLYDSVQYLFKPEFESALLHMRSLVKKGGLCIFDVVTESCVNRYWADHQETGNKNGWTYFRTSRYDRANRVLINEFDLFDFNSRRRYREKHEQYCYQVNEIRKLAEDSGWNVAGCLKDFTLDEGGEEADRLHFVLKKEEL